MSDDLDPKPPPRVMFLCGCAIPAVSESLELDDAFFAICPAHKQRRYGWRSQLKDRHRAHPFNPENPQFVEVVNRARDHQENEIEFWRRLGIDIVKKALIVKVEEKQLLDALDEIAANY